MNAQAKGSQANAKTSSRRPVGGAASSGGTSSRNISSSNGPDESSEVVVETKSSSKSNNSGNSSNVHGTKGATKPSASSSSSSSSSASSGEAVIRFKSSFRNTIYDVLKRRWKESETDWNFYWADRDFIYEILDTVHLDSSQRVNHFRNAKELCRKDLLIKNLKRKKRDLEKQGNLDEAASYDFFPVTYVLPGDYALFVEEFKRNQGVWIMKPVGSAQGKGIFLFSKLAQISNWRTDFRWSPENDQVEAYIVQRYINNPYLIGGKKFDLRLYALVTSFSPLQVYMYRGGFTRFTNHRYSNDANDIANSFIHLTNVAIQKTSDNYDSKTGGKWDLRGLKLHLISLHGVEAIDKLFYDMQMIIIRSLNSVSKVIISDRHCFELYGYDVMIDDTLKPWLLEVNASPSLSANTAADYQFKCEMLNDMLDVIDLERKLKGDEDRIGGFDLVCRSDEIVSTDPHSVYSTFFGGDYHHGNLRKIHIKDRNSRRESKSG